MITQKYITSLSYKIVGCAIEVHKYLGPGLLESTYEDCMLEEFKIQGLTAIRQINVPINYKGLQTSHPLRLDLLVEDLVIVELKAVEVILPVHKAQLLTYMKLARKPQGLLINFFTDNITKSAVPLINDHFKQYPIA